MEIVIADGKQKVMIRGGDSAFELCEERRQKGQIVWLAVGWYADLGAALNAVAKRKVRNSDAKTLQELKAVVLAVRKELTEVWTMERQAV